MSREQICVWLKIPAEPWPPDPFVLLGLPAGETDRDLIERQVHDRMEVLRRYQLAHPEDVTEVMNRLAQAFNDLCQARPSALPAVKPETEIVIAPSQLPPPELLRPIEPADNPPLPLPPALVPAADPALETARSPEARRGLATKRALYQRIATTRMLLRAWVQAGQYLADPSYRLRTKEEAIDLARQLTIIRQQLQSFPALVGQAGQPGYYVIALARQPRIVQTYQTLSDSERERLVHDWEAGLRFLAAHRLFLREEIETLRQKSWLGRLGRAGVGLLNDYPIIWLFLIGLLALNIAHPPLRADWALQFLVIGGAVMVFLLYHGYRIWSRRASLHRRRRRSSQRVEVVEAKRA